MFSRSKSSGCPAPGDGVYSGCPAPGDGAGQPRVGENLELAYVGICLAKSPTWGGHELAKKPVIPGGYYLSESLEKNTMLARL
jgi:hypothetical protein